MDLAYGSGSINDNKHSDVEDENDKSLPKIHLHIRQKHAVKFML